jgi:hypothetical protein
MVFPPRGRRNRATREMVVVAGFDYVCHLDHTHFLPRSVIFSGSRSRFLTFRATKMVTSETECGDLDACFAERSKRYGHVTPSQLLPTPLCSCNVRPSAEARLLRPSTLQPARPAACAPASPSRSLPAGASGCCAQSAPEPAPRALYGN